MISDGTDDGDEEEEGKDEEGKQEEVERGRSEGSIVRRVGQIGH